ncbi:MAG: 4Fe-4S dicluster domain-containing protein [candidate division Zixibacteria bacterium]|nr:4Fe-4S dicluster domain-containing protein [candidate division Zixibacteria bacterium]
MIRTHKKTLANVEIVSRLCKGCGFCVQACVQDCLAISKDINERGYNYAYYLGEGCTGCGLCFYSCPEPSAITIIRHPVKRDP